MAAKVLLMILAVMVEQISSEPDMYQSDQTDDFASVTWMQSASAGSMFKVITPNPWNDEKSRSFLKVRAFLSRNINLTITLQSSSPYDRITAYAMADSNIATEKGTLFANMTYNYMDNTDYNYTMIPNTVIEWIPLWTGEAFYMESSGDLSGTTISQDLEIDKTLCEVVTGSDNIIVGEGTNAMDMASGMVLDSAPALPTMWGAEFVFPLVPAAMWRGGYTAKYVTWEPWQHMDIIFQNGTEKMVNYPGHGAGVVYMFANEPLFISTDRIAHMAMLTWSGTTLPPAMLHIPDVRSGTSFYEIDTVEYEDVGAEIYISIVIKHQMFNLVKTLPLGEVEPQDFALLPGEYEQINDFGCGVMLIPSDIFSIQVYTDYYNGQLVNFMVFMFAKCTNDECAMAAATQTGTVDTIDFGSYTGKPPTSDPNMGPDGVSTPAPPSTEPPAAVTTQPGGDPSTAGPGPAGPSTAGPGGDTSPAAPGTTAGPPGTTAKPLPDGFLPENPFEGMCPCMHISNLALWPQFAGTYIRVLHGEGISDNTIKMWKQQYGEDFINRFGEVDGYASFNGRAIWRNSACEQYLFWHSGEVNYWLIGPEIGQTKGVMLNYGKAEFPVSDDLSHPWKFGDQNQWLEDEKATTTCSCADVEYESVHFNPSVPTDYEGYYYLYGMLNNHLLYKHLNYSYFLYYYQPDPNNPPVCKNDEWWGIGEYPGGAGPLAYIRDATYGPEKIGMGAEWRVFSGDWAAPDPWVTDISASLTAINIPALTQGAPVVEK